MLDKGFVLFSKNGIIKSVKLPKFGDLAIKTQNQFTRKCWLWLNLLLT